MLYKDSSDCWWTVVCRRVREEAGRLMEDHSCCPKLRRWCFGLRQSWCRWREVRLMCNTFIRESWQACWKIWWESWRQERNREWLLSFWLEWLRMRRLKEEKMWKGRKIKVLVDIHFCHSMFDPQPQSVEDNHCWVFHLCWSPLHKHILYLLGERRVLQPNKKAQATGEFSGFIW